MKYLKLFEEHKTEKTFQEYIDKGYPKIIYEKIEEFSCWGEKLISLKGIEKCKNLTFLECNNNKLTSLKEIENLPLIYLNVNGNYISDLKSIEKLTNLKELHCSDNELRNLNGIEKLTLLEEAYFTGNPWEFPLKPELVEKYNISYSEDDYDHFRTYKCQKEFIQKYPERADELKEFGYDKKILEEFPALVTGAEWGFFGLVE